VKLSVFELAVLIGLLAGCRHATPDVGASAFTVVESGRTATDAKVIVGDVGEPKPMPYSQDYRPASPLKNQPLPVYPERALRARAGAATVGVRVTVDATGKATEIGPSLLVYNTPGPFADDFLTAVTTTVRLWRFQPAEILSMEHVESPTASYNRIARTEKTEAQIDLAFTFTSRGGVTAAK
jgi:hypothetical protein